MLPVAGILQAIALIVSHLDGESQLISHEDGSLGLQLKVPARIRPSFGQQREQDALPLGGRHEKPVGTSPKSFGRRPKTSP